MELVVRVQWSGGFVDVSDGGTGTVRIVPFNASDATTRDAAIAIGTAALPTFAARESVSVNVGDTSTWPAVGDAVSTVGYSATATRRLITRRVNTTDNGHAVLVPTLGTAEESLLERQQLALDRMQSGTGRGRSAGVSPSGVVFSGIPNGAMRPVRVPPWSKTTPEVSDGPIWAVEQATLITKTAIILDVVAADDITVGLYVNGTGVVSIVLPGADNAIAQLGGLLLVPGDTLQMRITDVATNTTGDLDGLNLTVQFTSAPADLRVEREGR